MISSLKINNIALIENSLINFNSGFNVLTGETGAGKSIIIDSLNFVFGERADKTLIKTGKDYAKVEVVFELNTICDEIKNFFSSIFLEPENTIIISRFYNINGKNECRVNGEVVTLAMLKKLALNLVDIFGQHDNVALLEVKNHIKFIDALSPKIEELKTTLSKHLVALKQVNQSILDLGGDGKDKERNIRLLEHEISEIELFNLKDNEDVTLQNKQKLFLSSEKLKTNLQEILSNLSVGEQSVNAKLKNVSFSFNQISNISTQLTELKGRFQNCMYELVDISENLSDMLNQTDYSEEELNCVMERLDALNDLKRKYGKTIPLIFEYLTNAKTKLNNLINSNEKLEELLSEKSKILSQIYSDCTALTTTRKQVGEVLAKKMVRELCDLGIKNASFVANFSNCYTLENIESKVTPLGADNIEFLFSANIGVEPRPLAKIISGGELSRFMLAFKCVCHDSNLEKTMVFDEIDAGIGGLIGLEIGKKIANLSQKNQVLCVTHLAQIATFADAHFKIEKSEDNKVTLSNVFKLSDNQIVNEIARMIGSKENSEYGKLNAGELLADAVKYKNKLV